MTKIHCLKNIFNKNWRVFNCVININIPFGEQIRKERLFIVVCVSS